MIILCLNNFKNYIYTQDKFFYVFDYAYEGSQ